ncbi:hypothetical protein [Nocardia ignorata]|uniref:Uncharacterized protein n=1 Tax=Nocardia ignorata TaxID=145285 RepID=A0A4R6PXG9_NOCIG|nr:hypothetical protein [Nocardia ignorata]TDP43117.1 hypothetical protein DFR75_1012238 [Nocardia ignorata]
MSWLDIDGHVVVAQFRSDLVEDDNGTNDGHRLPLRESGGPNRIGQVCVELSITIRSNDSVRYKLSDDSDWKIGSSEGMNLILSAIQERSEAGMTVGVDIYFQDSSLAASVLIPPASTEVYFVLSNERALIEHTDFADFIWYLRRLIRPIAELGMTGYECHDFYPR